jgi:hypothetical protein
MHPVLASSSCCSASASRQVPSSGSHREPRGTGVVPELDASRRPWWIATSMAANNWWTHCSCGSVVVPSLAGFLNCSAATARLGSYGTTGVVIDP